MPIESINYLPSLALQRAWDNPKLAEWSDVSISNRGRILCATINSILVLANVYLIMENLL